MILFHEYMDKREIKSGSGLYKDLQMVASRSQDREECAPIQSSIALDW